MQGFTQAARSSSLNATGTGVMHGFQRGQSSVPRPTKPHQLPQNEAPMAPNPKIGGPSPNHTDSSKP